MGDTTEKTIADELRAAAARLRDAEHHGGITGDCDNPGLLSLIVALLGAREPLASWLEKTAHIVDSFRLPSHPEHEPCDDPCCYTAHHALAVARVLNGSDRG